MFMCQAKKNGSCAFVIIQKALFARCTQWIKLQNLFHSTNLLQVCALKSLVTARHKLNEPTRSERAVYKNLSVSRYEVDCMDHTSYLKGKLGVSLIGHKHHANSWTTYIDTDGQQLWINKICIKVAVCQLMSVFTTRLVKNVKRKYCFSRDLLDKNYNVLTNFKQKGEIGRTSIPNLNYIHILSEMSIMLKI